MEKLSNCNLIIDIESVENISGANQEYEIFFVSTEGDRYKVVFDYVWDIKCSIENVYIERFSKIVHTEKEKSSILVIDNSESIKFLEKQMSGTRPTQGLKNYIVIDKVDTIIEVLCLKEPALFKI